MSPIPIASKMFLHMGQSLLTGAHILTLSLFLYISTFAWDEVAYGSFGSHFVHT